jgi:hypothetical protein
MQGDYSRFTFDRRKHYNGVLVQQGRVQLDADANEQGAIQAHRDRTEAADTVGPCGAPKSDGGFRVLPLAAGVPNLGITAGRMYVDGFLCEVGGSPLPILANPATNQVQLAALDADGSALKATEWVELSSRTRPTTFFRITEVDPDGRRLTLSADAGAYTPADGAVARRAVTYTTQPDYPKPPALGPKAGDRMLLYLDVWERHVTAVEDPSIREVALGGPDTTARVQTVCQVKIHLTPGSGQLGCTDPVPGWPPPASAGRLSANATEPPPSTDPCGIAPDGGFRGLENRLYRVEIHKSGSPDAAATFTWSRDNGAVLFAVEQILDAKAGRVQVRRLGRDDVLTLRETDWVEVLDDTVELSGERGVMARVSDIRSLDRSLTLTPPVPGLDPAGHPRLRRWDVPTTDADGVLPALTTPTHLEKGVEVRFSGSGFRAGDWWTIPARVLTGRAGPLVDAPPEGIAHHYCRLALVGWTQAAAVLEATVTDCRPAFPPLTAIEATDVGYDPAACTLDRDARILATALGHPVAGGPVDDVQEALDVLCLREVTYQHLVYVAGDGQEGPPGTQLPVQPTVAVRNALGQPVRNVTVAFSPDGQGSVPSPTATTGTTGEARLPWTLGSGGGLNQLVARLTPPQGGSQQVRFNARGTVPQGGGGLCSFTVGDGVRSQGNFAGADGLRDAVAAAIAAGGATICVLPGRYALARPVDVTGASNLTIQGSRLETVVEARSVPAFRFSNCVDVALRDLQVIGIDLRPEVAPEGIVSFRRCAGLTVQTCGLRAESAGGAPTTVSCLLLQECEGVVDVRDCDVSTDGSGPLGGIALRRTPGARLRGNTVRLSADQGRFGIDLEDACHSCLVVDNTVEGSLPEAGGFAGSLGGVHVGSGCEQVVVRHNRIDGGAGPGVALGSTGADGDSLGGLLGLTVDRNDIQRMAAGGVGVLGWRASAEAEPLQPVTDRLTVTGNHIQGCCYDLAPALIFPVGVAVRGFRLAGAVVVWMGDGICLLDNDIVDNGQLDGRKAPHPVPGILMLRVGAGLTISRNRVRRNASPERGDPNGLGTVTGGVAIGNTFESADSVATLSANDVVSPIGPALRLAVPNDRAGNVHVTGNYLEGEGSNSNVLLKNPFGSIQFVDNDVISRPTEGAVCVAISARHVLFNSNRCICPEAAPQRVHVQVECGASAGATGNQVLEEENEARTSLRLVQASDPPFGLTAVANVTTNGVLLDPQGADAANVTGIAR